MTEIDKTLEAIEALPDDGRSVILPHHPTPASHYQIPMADLKALVNELRRYQAMIDHVASMSTSFGRLEQHVGDRWSAEEQDGWFNTALDAFETLAGGISDGK